MSQPEKIRQAPEEAAFQKYDVDNSGLLEPMEFCRALHVGASQSKEDSGAVLFRLNKGAYV